MTRHRRPPSEPPASTGSNGLDGLTDLSGSTGVTGSTDASSDQGARRSHPGRIDVILVGWLTVLLMACTVAVTLFLPLYVGRVPLPGSALVGAVLVYAVVRIGLLLTNSMAGGVIPAVGWLVAAIGVSTSTRFGYGLVLGDWRALLMLGAGAMAAAAALALFVGTRAPAPERVSQRPVDADAVPVRTRSVEQSGGDG